MNATVVYPGKYDVHIVLSASMRNLGVAAPLP